MGVVYRARDTKLGRDVALKVLPNSVAHDPERVARFEREAHVLAALNHPSIAHIYGFEDATGVPALVMELVEGPTLADRLAHGPLSLDEALPIAKQISEALEAAHEQGIIHRDLKPANVKVRADGTVKVLDFGLAKAFDLSSPDTSATMSPTLSVHATQAGIILGTAAYMAPEQARGKQVDKRADIWAFGVVLYEMLIGRRLFDGETISDTLAGVLTKDPDWVRVPQRAQRLLKRCLEKDPRRRLRDVGDAWSLLDDSPAPVRARRARPWTMVAAVAVVFALALWVSWRRTRSEDAPRAIALDFDLGPDVSLGLGVVGPPFALSNDGTQIAYVSGGSDGVRHLFIRRLDQPKAVILAKTEGAYEPFFSPDGQWVGFFAQGKLKKTRIDGGEPTTLCDAASGRGASWGEDGNIIAALQPQSVLSQVSAAGGTATPISELGPGEGTHRWPQILPGGNAVLFSLNDTVSTNFDESSIAVLSLIDHRKKIVLQHVGFFPRYLPSGHLVYVSKGTLHAVAFDLAHLEVNGAGSVLQEVSSDNSRAFAQFDISSAGILAFRAGGGITGRGALHWLDATGHLEPVGLEPDVYSYPRLSPDGARLAYVISQPSIADLWIYDWQRHLVSRITKDRIAAFPVWSPDGQFVVFQSPGGMFSARTDGTGGIQQLTQSRNQQTPAFFTSDGAKLLFTESTPAGGGEIKIATIERSPGQLHAATIELFLVSSTVQTFPSLSHDGRWISYADNAQSGSYEVYVRAFPGETTGRRWQVSNAGGTIPIWSANGQELFYRTGDQQIMVANYTVNGSDFVPQKLRAWSATRLANVGLAVNLDLAVDGKRFVALMPAEGSEPGATQSHVTLVVNFFDEVRRRLAQRMK